MAGSFITSAEYQIRFGTAATIRRLIARLRKRSMSALVDRFDEK
jgi:hypothetical protein